MLPSIAFTLPGSFALLVPLAHADKEVGMRLDPEGHLIIGERFLPPRNAGSLHNDGSTTTRTDDLPDLFLSPSYPTTWERNAARLCQRIGEVQTLIQEDLREIEEPMFTLGTIASTLSHEHVMRWEAAKAAYAQAFLECTNVLARILSPFAETQKPLEQRRELADSVLSHMEAVCR